MYTALQRLQHVMKMFSFQVLVVTLDRQAEKGVKDMTFNVECCNTSGCCHTHSTVEEMSQAVNELIASLSPLCTNEKSKEGGA